MEDALISAEGFMILSGAGLVEASEGATIKQHVTETVDASGSLVVPSDGKDSLDIYISKAPYLPEGAEDFAYVMLVKDGEIVSEPFIPAHEGEVTATTGMTGKDEVQNDKFKITVKATTDGETYNLDPAAPFDAKKFDSVIVDYYTEKKAGIKQIEITADKFGGNYYLEASTLFRTQSGLDLPAEFIIPNCKVQSNFNFSMAASGDPSTFTFTMDAFPDYTRFDHSKKVLAAIQIIEDSLDADVVRTQTDHDKTHESKVIL